MRPASPGPGPPGCSARRGPSAPNFANFGTGGPCWAAEARAGMHRSLALSLATQVVFSPGSPQGPQPPAPSPLPPSKTTSGRRDGGQARAGGEGPGPRRRPCTGRGPRSHLGRSAPQPPDSSPPTARLLCCRSSSLGFLECTGLPEPSPAPPPPRPGEGLAEREGRGGEKGEEEHQLQGPGRAAGPGLGALTRPAARSCTTNGHKTLRGGNRVRSRTETQRAPGLTRGSFH